MNCTLLGFTVLFLAASSLWAQGWVHDHVQALVQTVLGMPVHAHERGQLAGGESLKGR